VANAVVDSARLEINRRSRRANTARLEVHQLRTMRRRQAAGEKQGWRVVRGPSVVAEARRQRHRDRLPTQRDRPRVLNRLKGLLAGGGIRMTLPGDVEPQRDEVRQGDDAPLPAALRAPEAGVAEGPASHGAPREPGGRAARGVAPQ
jgi:transposase